MGEVLTDAMLCTEIDETKDQIAAHHKAIKEVLCGGRSYSLDSGQTRQQVTRHSLGELRNSLSGLYNWLRWLESQKCRGSNTTYGRPAF